MSALGGFSKANWRMWHGVDWLGRWISMVAMDTMDSEVEL